MNKLIDEYKPSKLIKEEKEFVKYSKLYEKRFGKKGKSKEYNL